MSKTQHLNPIIDADSLVWNCGFMSNDGDDDPPLGFHLQAVKRSMESILWNFPDRSYTKVYIGGEGNFRHAVAFTKPYKGTRKQEKPKYYQEIREYLVERWGAEIVNGEEADDAVGKWQWSHPDKSTCIVAQDKDLKTIPGWHYWWKLQKMEWITPRDANIFFLRQMLTGDNSDNIPGVPEIGDKTADKIIQQAGGGVMKLVSLVEREYQKAYGVDWQRVMDEQGTLLHIRRVDGKGWKDFIYKGTKQDGTANKQDRNDAIVNSDDRATSNSEAVGDSVEGQRGTAGAVGGEG